MKNEFDIIRENKGGVVEVTEETYYEALGAVPPICAHNCFGMGEIASHTSDGEEEYYFFGSIPVTPQDKENFRHFGFLGTLEKAQNAFSAIKGKNTITGETANWN